MEHWISKRLRVPWIVGHSLEISRFSKPERHIEWEGNGYVVCLYLVWMILNYIGPIWWDAVYAKVFVAVGDAIRSTCGSLICLVHFTVQNNYFCMFCDRLLNALLLVYFITLSFIPFQGFFRLAEWIKICCSSFLSEVQLFRDLCYRFLILKSDLRGSFLPTIIIHYLSNIMIYGAFIGLS